MTMIASTAWFNPAAYVVGALAMVGAYDMGTRWSERQVPGTWRSLPGERQVPAWIPGVSATRVG